MNKVRAASCEDAGVELACVEVTERSQFMRNGRGEKSTDQKCEDDRKLPFPDYEAYYHAIVTDHVSGVEEMLSTCSDGDLNRILNGQFEYDSVDPDADCCLNSAEGDLPVQTPLGVAATSGSMRVLSALLENHVDVMQPEVDGNNVIHLLVLTSEQHPDVERRLTDVYDFLCANVPRVSLCWLLRAENGDDMTPLELAADRATYLLVDAILHTRGVHLARVVTSNVTSYLWYDITEYESTNAEVGKRRTHSPLVKFLQLPRDRLTDPVVHALVDRKRGFIGQWVSAKERAYFGPLVLIFLWRVVLVVLYSLYCMDIRWAENYGGRPDTRGRAGDITSGHVSSSTGGLTTYTPDSTYRSMRISERESNGDAGNAGFTFCPNSMSRLPKVALEVIKYIVIASGALCWLSEVWLLFLRMRHRESRRADRNLLSTFGKRIRKLVLQWEAYLFGQLCLPFVMIAVVVLQPLCTDRGSHFAVFVDVLRISSQIDVILYLCFFLQLSPFFGPFVITIMRLVGDLFRFSVVFFIVIKLFSGLFMVLVNIKTEQGCIPEYDGIARSMYTMFTMTLNMASLTQYKLVTPGVVYALHVICALFVGVLLFNFLIGVLSTSVAEMAANMRVICLVQHTFVVTSLELRHWPLLRYYYRLVQPYYFTCVKGRVFLVRRLHPEKARKIIR